MLKIVGLHSRVMLRASDETNTEIIEFSLRGALCKNTNGVFEQKINTTFPMDRLHAKSTQRCNGYTTLCE